MATKKSIKEFYLPHTKKLYGNKVFKKRILAYNGEPVRVYKETDEYKLFKRIFVHYLEEAEKTLSLLERIDFGKSDSLLEVGGGLGLIYGFLKHYGYDIVAIEPSSSGYDDFYNAGKVLLKTIGVPTSNWKPYLAMELSKLDKRFDIIFSNNVLEHIMDLKDNFRSMKAALKPRGVMIHNTVNYFVPYEPHFKIPIFPFFPRLTEIFKPFLKSSHIWENINFTNPINLSKAAKENELQIKFIGEQLYETLTRLDHDHEFAARHNHFKKVYDLFKGNKINLSI